MKGKALLLAGIWGLLGLGASARAAEPMAFDPYVLGYETEPGMDTSGRMVASLHSAGSRALGLAFHADRHPGVQPAWEFPLGAALLLVQHEVGGHGGRAREFDLGPSYRFHFDFSAATSVRRTPADPLEIITLAAGGAEADGVMAHRILSDLAGPRGVDGAKLPLALMAKLDLTLYVLETPRPRAGGGRDSFTGEYENGNDVAIYLVGRQAQRLHVPAGVIWSGTYGIDFAEGRLRDTWDDARATALWNLLDPSLVAAMISYFRGHVLAGESRVHGLGLALPGGSRLLVGTRGALGPQSVSRFLDLYWGGDRGLLTAYVRDLDSSIDRAWGAGLGVRNVRLGTRAELALAVDSWREPRSEEGLYRGTGWNATVELDAALTPRFGLTAKAGSKSAGFLPGLPLDRGGYLGLGVTATF